MTGSRRPLPRWIDIGLIPVVNVVLAFIVAGLVMLTIGVNPFHVVRVMLVGSFGYLEAIGYTLYYATNFVFAGLAVALAFHAGLFNIGAEGQAYVGGLGSALAVLAFDTTFSPFLLIVLVPRVISR
jgi:simple sugar transport system permease protein